MILQHQDQVYSGQIRGLAMGGRISGTLAILDILAMDRFEQLKVADLQISIFHGLRKLHINNLDVAGQRKTIVRKAAQFITQPLFFTKAFAPLTLQVKYGGIKKERKKERKVAQLYM